MKDIKSISPGTQFCVIIGNPVSHSMSPAIHNAAFTELGLDFVYLACQVEDVGAALGGMRALGNFRGMSVTIPHKIEAMKWVDEVAEVDRSIGSINTVIKEGGKLKGYGTDGPGALKALVDGGADPKGKEVLILGSGGAARAIGFNLARSGGVKALTLLDINGDLLKGLTNDLKSGTKTPITGKLLDNPSLAEGMEKADLIINCTSVGMHPKEDASLVPPELFRPGQSVLDIVYNPLETKFLREAREKGLRAISGVEMFVNQAVLQFKLFTGLEAPYEVMRKVVLENLRK